MWNPIAKRMRLKCQSTKPRKNPLRTRRLVKLNIQVQEQNCPSWFYGNSRVMWRTTEHFGRRKSAVIKNTELTTVDKFNYLFPLLEGKALCAIKGLAITESNYQAAIDILHERFGKSQQIISGHMDELLKIPPCIGDKASQLRFVYDKLSVNVRG